MHRRRLTLGLDLSTQSLSSVVIDIDSGQKVLEHSLDYLNDRRLAGFGIEAESYIVPPRVEGEADQPPLMFFASLDAMFADLKEAGVSMEEIVVCNFSAQQHGHIYLNKEAPFLFACLKQPGSGENSLTTLLKGCLAYHLAPIWMTSNTTGQADFIRKHVGGMERLIQISGSNAPLRFTGIIIRRVAEQFPHAYEQTHTIQLLSSLMPAVLTGNSKVPLDFGNACGMSLMDYRKRNWSTPMVQAVSEGLPGGQSALMSKLPSIVPPDTTVGNIATYFVERYGFSPDCKIIVGSGDNPQSKVLVSGDLLSLGSSLVNMVSTDGKTLDMNGFANAMYDGVGRPFMFGCRTNGALVWDQLRASYGLAKGKYAPAEAALQKSPVAHYMVLWQPRNESFPPAGSFGMMRVSHETPDLGTDYAGIIESSLSSVYLHSKNFTSETSEPMYVTGGPTSSSGIMRRIAAIWNRPLFPIERGGAALGAAVAGAWAFKKSIGEEIDIEDFSLRQLKRMRPVHPRPEDVVAYHGPAGYLEKLASVESTVIRTHLLE